MHGNKWRYPILLVHLNSDMKENFPQPDNLKLLLLVPSIQVVKEGDFGTTVNQLTESGLSVVPMVVEATMAEEVVVVKEVVEEGKKEVNKKRATLRKGSEGEDVRAMQVWLLANIHLSSVKCTRRVLFVLYMNVITWT